MILVTGAGGHVGSELVEQLAAAGVPVRAMSRRPETLTVPDGVQTIYGDCDEPDSLGPAFAGVEQAFLMSAEHVGSAAGPTHEAAMVAAAQQAGVKHLVKLSVYFSDSSDSI